MSLANTVSICLVCFFFLFLLFIFSKDLHKLVMDQINAHYQIIVYLTIIVTVLICTLPMSLSPYWNGTIHIAPDMQQYGRLADALLDGHLYIDKGDIDPALEAMKNPYDTVERERLGIKYHWDEVYYNHHYYTYFGIVPTVILFIPYKILTGNMLLSYQATQIFAGMSIVGIFYLFFVLCKFLFPNFPFSLYLLLSVALSILSIGYSIAAPALYCTAIISAICLMIWSMICFIKGTWIEPNILVSRAYLLIGGLLGALAFGCRPPVALANIVILAVILHISNKNIPFQEKVKLYICLLIPYILVGMILLLYNYARFGNVFEFGVSYQLTIADQHLYHNFSERFDILRILAGSSCLLFSVSGFTGTFPYLLFSGVFVNFPILFISLHVFSKSISEFLQKKKFKDFVFLLFVLPFLISAVDVYWTPVPLPRYQLDFNYLFCLVTFIVSGVWVVHLKGKRKEIMMRILVLLSFLTVIVQFLLFCLPFDCSYTMFYPEILEAIKRGLLFMYY